MAALNLLPPLDDPPPLTRTILPEIPPFDVAMIMSKVKTNPRLSRTRPAITFSLLAWLAFCSLLSGTCDTVLVRRLYITRLTTEVVSAKGNTEIYDLGRIYIDHLICSFRTTITPITPPSNYPSRPSMGQLENFLANAIQDSGTDHRSARTRAHARDGYHYTVTNTIDANSFEKHTAIKKLCSETGAAVHDVQTCYKYIQQIYLCKTSSQATSIHIKLVLVFPFPDEYDDLCDLHVLQRQHAGAALGILKRFGLEDIVERFITISRGDTASTSAVHDLLNIVSLIGDLHVAFHQLKLAFEPTPNANTYDIVFTYPEISRISGLTEPSHADQFRAKAQIQERQRSA
ncbi:hypothetical protein MVEN_00650700 [Mycena venus]|uniref:Uncharacterized protein n=1 Tax=Mycena venus TaxID=2733690 RepID=A0A8H6YRF6_9AGAR|nr:hypothetical protein MVEN_00650700 [Mycena venus]